MALKDLLVYVDQSNASLGHLELSDVPADAIAAALQETARAAGADLLSQLELPVMMSN